MNSFVLTIVLSLTMFVGSVISGLMPLMIKASNRIMNLVSIFGAGLLVGVALIIIIPEGMLTLNAALEARELKETPITEEVKALLMNSANFTLEQVTNFHLHKEGESEIASLYLGGSLILGFLIMLLIDQLFHILTDRWSSKEDSDSEETMSLKEKLIKRTDWKYLQNSIQSARGKCLKVTRAASTKPKSLRMLSDDFVDKELVDAMGNKYFKHDHFEEQHEENESHEHESHEHAHDHFHGDKSTLFITTFGLIVHSMADGIALGTTWYASQDKESSLPFIIFMALFLHKCPEAIGLTTFLRHENLAFNKILSHLVPYTITSPLSAVLAYLAFSYFSISYEEGSQAFVAVGVLLLISAGTFMYVAMIHILPEVYCNTETHRPHTHKHRPEDHVHDESHFSKEIELITMVSGLLLPLCLHLF